MSLDVSDAIALAKDLLQTSSEFHAHDPDLAARFAGRAFEICDDLGIDRSLVGDQLAEAGDRSLEAVAEATSTPAPIDVMPGDLEEDTQQTNEQLSALLKQQARVLQNAREVEAEQPKASKRSFWRFGRASPSDGLGALQSA